MKRNEAWRITGAHSWSQSSSRPESARQLADAPPLSRGIYLARALLILVPVVNVLWYPLFGTDIGRAVNFVPMDIVLLSCWALAVVGPIRDSRLDETQRLAWWVVVLANAPLVLSPLASYFGADGANLTAGLVSHLKRLGLASVIVPLAVWCRLHHGRRLVAVSCLAGALFLYFAQPEWLGRDESLYFFGSAGRVAAVVFNPNVLTYVAGIYLLFLLIFQDREPNVMVRVALWAGILVSALSLLAGASRSGSAAMLPAALYLFVKRPSLRPVFVLGTVALVVVFLASPDDLSQSVFAARWQRAVSSGLQERNLLARLEIQSEVVAASADYPLGTGIGSVGSDSLYVDYLGTMGFAGMLSVLWLFWTCWRCQSASSIESVAARTIMVYAITFSLAAIGLASNFVSPLFFLAIGLGMSSRADERALPDGLHPVSGGGVIPTAIGRPAERVRDGGTG